MYSLTKNALLRLLIKLLIFLQKKPRSQPEKILFVSTTGLGDTLWATPIIHTYKISHPHHSLTLLTSPSGYEVFRENPYIDKICILQKPLLSRFFALFRLCKREQFAIAYLLHTSQRLVLPLLAALQIPCRVGTAGRQKGLDDLLTTIVSPKATQHEIAKRLDLINAEKSIAQNLEIFLTEKDKRVAKQYIDQKPLIVMHPGAKDSFKRWPAEHFITLGKELMRCLTANILITGNAEEKTLCEQIAQEIPGALSLAGQLSIREMAGLLDHVQLMITNDTGPMHLAFALKAPVIGLFCSTDPNICGPYFPCSHAHIVHRKPTCNPCLQKKCRDPFCFLQITPKEIVDLVIKIRKDQQNPLKSEVYEQSPV